jgi:hypothetical protein
MVSFLETDMALLIYSQSFTRRYLVNIINFIASRWWLWLIISAFGTPLFSFALIIQTANLGINTSNTAREINQAMAPIATQAIIYASLIVTSWSLLIVAIISKTVKRIKAAV